jgi:hypothetical protein
MWTSWRQLGLLTRQGLAPFNGLGKDGSGDLGVARAQGTRPHDVCRGEAGQPSAPFPGGRLGRMKGDPGPPTPSGPDKTRALQLTIRPCHRSHREAEITGQLPQWREPLTLDELASLDQVRQLAA